MKRWKALTAGFVIFLLSLALPCIMAFAEEQETEDPYPDSYYDTIESNEISGWPQGPRTESAAAVVMDMDTGALLYSKNATEKMYPASTTKIMTALLAIENCDLSDEITFSEIVYDLEEGSSHLGIQAGEKMKLRDALYGLMLASANDIANGIAEHIGGSLSGFADMMNAKAEELGCVNTHFANPHGLYQEDHYTCAYDLALIAQAAYRNRVFRRIVRTQEYTIPETNLTEEERSFVNHHKMLLDYEEYYRGWCKGGKNGFTSQCLNTLVTYGEKDGKRLVSVVLRVNGADKAYQDTTAIMEYGFSRFARENLEIGDADRTFYDIMGLNYPGTVSEFQSPVWQRTPVRGMSCTVTLPDTAELSSLTYRAEDGGLGRPVLSCEYNGWPVGSMSGEVETVIYAPAQLVFERDVEVQTADTAEVSSDGHIQIESVNEALSQASVLFQNIYRAVAEYTENHFITALAAGVITLAVLILLIIVLVFRCSSEARIRRRRQQEEKERRKREEEIDRMTTAEIEAELRAVMEQERLKKEQEKLARAEAERAAEEARIMEEKAHETERLIDELERERQERLAAKKGTV